MTKLGKRNARKSRTPTVNTKHLTRETLEQTLLGARKKTTKRAVSLEKMKERHAVQLTQNQLLVLGDAVAEIDVNEEHKALLEEILNKDATGELRKDWLGNLRNIRNNLVRQT